MVQQCWRVNPFFLRSIAAGVLLLSAPVCGQNPNQFGGAQRAQNPGRIIVQLVEQGITSLPPTSGQSFTYEFSPTFSTYIRRMQLGPTSFRTPTTIGAGKLSVRLAASYFDFNATLGPILHVVNDPPGTPLGIAALGLETGARVGQINLAASYGLSNRFEMTMNLPVVVVDAQASQIFTTTTPTGPPQEARLSGVAIFNGDVATGIAGLKQALQPGGGLFIRKESFKNLGFDFNEGTHIGVGRISIGAKGLLYTGQRLQIAAAPEFFFPSPNEEQFSGSGTAAILPRAVAGFGVADPLKLYADAGYDYDFDVDTLRRFIWNLGASVPLSWASFDVGVGGSKFNQGVEFTPARTTFVDFSGSPGTVQAIENTRLGDNFVDVLLGAKLRVTNSLLLSAAVSIPVTNQDFRPSALGTLGVELYL